MPSANQFASASNIQAKSYASNGAEKVTPIESLHHKKPVIQSQQPNRTLNTNLKPIFSFSKSERTLYYRHQITNRINIQILIQ